MYRTFGVPPAAASPFTDVARTSVHAEAIDALYAAGITTGCVRDTRFCPDNRANRDHAATFIVLGRCYYHLYLFDSKCYTPTPPIITPPQLHPPGKPTNIDITPGQGTLTITWQPTGPAATNWQIRYSHTVHHTLPYPRDEIIEQTHDVTTAAVPPGGVTITDLKFSTEYTIEIKGHNIDGYGPWSDPESATTPAAAVKLVALEVTQGLQDWNGSIDLVAGKRTVVRAFFESVEDDIFEVLAAQQRIEPVLYAVRSDGTKLDPIEPINHTGPMLPLPDAAGRRDQLGTSLNFLLHAGSVHTASDIASYRIEFVGQRADCEESRPPARTCEASVSFVDVDVPRVAMIPISISGDRPTDADLREQAARILSLMPIPSLDYRIIDLGIDIDFRPEPGDVHNALGINRNLNGDTRIYFGIMPGQPPARTLGRADGIPAVVASWYIDSVGDDSTEGIGTLLYGRNTGSHEFAHTIGGRHAAHEYNNRFHTICSTDGGIPDVVAGEPGEVQEYPYQRGTIAGGDHVALIGPDPSGVATDNEEIWGLDTRFVTGYGLNALLSSLRRQQLAVLDPSEAYSIMSYCLSPGAVEFTWIDGHHHRLFVDLINAIDWSEGPQPSDGSWWEFFSGDWASGEQGGGAGEARVAPTLRLQPTSAPSEPEGGGDYVLELLNTEGKVLRSVRFAGSAGVDNVGQRQNAEQARERWALGVRNPPDYDSYRIKRLSEVIASVQRSAAAPAVAVTSPSAGQVLSGDMVHFSWTASDGDGDDLTYLVQYSIDAGANYETIASGLDSKTLRRKRGTLAGSTQARIRVVASDGARSSTAESAVFAVAASAPEVFISSPGDASLLVGPRTVVLQASARDAEDGELDGTAIAWSSSLDGPLGTGAAVEVATAALSEGPHTLTATATDSSTAQASSSVTVTVRHTRGAASLRDDIVFAVGASAVVADVTANDEDPDGSLADYALGVLVPPAVGAAGPHRRAGAAPALSYVPAAGGYDALVYTVCDLSGQCGTAELTVAVLADG